MEWRDWELFCEVVEHGGFSAAARALGHPKSSLSAAVQRLEGNLGLRLIDARRVICGSPMPATPSTSG